MNLASGVKQMLKNGCRGNQEPHTALTGAFTSQIDSVEGTVPLATKFASAQCNFERGNDLYPAVH